MADEKPPNKNMDKKFNEKKNKTQSNQRDTGTSRRPPRYGNDEWDHYRRSRFGAFEHWNLYRSSGIEQMGPNINDHLRSTNDAFNVPNMSRPTFTRNEVPVTGNLRPNYNCQKRNVYNPISANVSHTQKASGIAKPYDANRQRSNTTLAGSSQINKTTSGNAVSDYSKQKRKNTHKATSLTAGTSHVNKMPGNVLSVTSRSVSPQGTRNVEENVAPQSYTGTKSKRRNSQDPSPVSDSFTTNDNLNVLNMSDNTHIQLSSNAANNQKDGVVTPSQNDSELTNKNVSEDSGNIAPPSHNNKERDPKTYRHNKLPLDHELIRTNNTDLNACKDITSSPDCESRKVNQSDPDTSVNTVSHPETQSPNTHQTGQDITSPYEYEPPKVPNSGNNSENTVSLSDAALASPNNTSEDTPPIEDTPLKFSVSNYKNHKSDNRQTGNKHANRSTTYVNQQNRKQRFYKKNEFQRNKKKNSEGRQPNKAQDVKVSNEQVLAKCDKAVQTESSASWGQSMNLSENTSSNAITSNPSSSSLSPGSSMSPPTLTSRPPLLLPILQLPAPYSQQLYYYYYVSYSYTYPIYCSYPMTYVSQQMYQPMSPVSQYGPVYYYPVHFVPMIPIEGPIRYQYTSFNMQSQNDVLLGFGNGNTAANNQLTHESNQPSPPSIAYMNVTPPPEGNSNNNNGASDGTPTYEHPPPPPPEENSNTNHSNNSNGASDETPTNEYQ